MANAVWVKRVKTPRQLKSLFAFDDILKADPAEDRLFSATQREFSEI